MSMTVGSRIAECLAARGVRSVFGVPGGQSYALYIGIENEPDIDHILMHDERSAGFAADAYARILGLGACDATVGPGATNLPSAVGEAYASSIPLIALISDIPTSWEARLDHQGTERRIMTSTMTQFEARNRHFDRLFNTPGLMWLGQNTNHFAPHPAVVKAMLDSIEREEYHAYAPPMGFEELRALILADLRLPDQSVLVTDGAIEALYNVCHTVCTPGTHFVTTDPGWKWPIHFAQAAGATTTELPIYDPAQAYKLTPAQLEGAVTDKTRLIYLVDPNNPLGTCYTRAEIEAFTRIAASVGAFFLHDCTYAHFADEHTLAARFYPERTFTIYSFSKWLGVAGLRIGAVVANGDLIRRLAVAPPNNLGSNVISQRVAIAGLRTKSEWFPAINLRQRRNQAEIVKAVAKVPGLSMAVYPSQANFVVVECIDAGVKPEALCEVYRGEGIMIRQGTYHTPRFGHRFVKVSTTVPEAWADAFCERLPAMVAKARTLTEVVALF